MLNGILLNFYCKSFFRFFLLVLCLAAVPSKAQLRIENAWVKQAPPGATALAAYMAISNPQALSQVIIGVSADCCEQAMLHKSRREGDSVSMEHVDQLLVTASESIKMVQGGLHIMLMKPQKDLVLNDVVDIVFYFNNGTVQTVSAIVQNDEQGSENAKLKTEVNVEKNPEVKPDKKPESPKESVTESSGNSSSNISMQRKMEASLTSQSSSDGATSKNE